MLTILTGQFVNFNIQVCTRKQTTASVDISLIGKLASTVSGS